MHTISSTPIETTGPDRVNGFALSFFPSMDWRKNMIKIEGEEMPEFDDDFEKPTKYSANKKGEQLTVRVG